MQSVWPPGVHVIGKDILKFHGIYWPAFLAAAGLELPRMLLVHAHWLVDYEKMSKSTGNVVTPQSCIDQVTATGLRYFLLHEGVPSSDGSQFECKISSRSVIIFNIITRFQPQEDGPDSQRGAGRRSREFSKPLLRQELEPDSGQKGRQPVVL